MSGDLRSPSKVRSSLSGDFIERRLDGRAIEPYPILARAPRQGTIENGHVVPQAQAMAHDTPLDSMSVSEKLQLMEDV